MKKLFLFLVFCMVLVPSARASFMQAVAGTGTGNPGTCTFSGSVTSGDIEVAGMSAVTVSSIASTRVSSWILGASTNHSLFYYGVATSSGAETVTITMPGSAGINLVCGEWNTSILDQLNLQNPGNTAVITTTHAISDLVCLGAGGAGGGVSMNSPFTTRVTNGGTNIVLGDQQVTSTGTYSCIIGSAFPLHRVGQFL
jgi:hypothetical protein